LPSRWIKINEILLILDGEHSLLSGIVPYYRWICGDWLERAMPSLDFRPINALQSKCTNWQSWRLAFRKVFGFSTQNKKEKNSIKIYKLLPSSRAGSLNDYALSVQFSTIKSLMFAYLFYEVWEPYVFPINFLFTNLLPCPKCDLVSGFVCSFSFFASNWTSNVCYILYAFLFCQ